MLADKYNHINFDYLQLFSYSSVFSSGLWVIHMDLKKIVSTISNEISDKSI